MEYLFTSKRLGFRNWVAEDIHKMAAISADKEVMKYFPYPATYKQTEEFVERMQRMFSEHGHCYYAVELLETKEFIGFIGLAYQDYEASFNPAVDAGWRLAKKHWGKGYATEGAKACLKYGFEDLGLTEIYAVATNANTNSFNVMKKIGMQFHSQLKHPRMPAHLGLTTCLYRLDYSCHYLQSFEVYGA